MPCRPSECAPSPAVQSSWSPTAAPDTDANTTPHADAAKRAATVSRAVAEPLQDPLRRCAARTEGEGRQGCGDQSTPTAVLGNLSGSRPARRADLRFRGVRRGPARRPGGR